MRKLIRMVALVVFFTAPAGAQPPAAAARITAIRAGRLLDPEAGGILANQIIVVEGNRIRDVGPNVQVPSGAQVIDLSRMTVMPGLVGSHNHLALAYKPEPENNVCYYTYVQDSTALRAIQAASNGIQIVVMKDGLVFKRDGVMTPAPFFHGGPVDGWRIR